MKARIGVGILLVLCGFWLPTVSSRMVKRMSQVEEGPVVKMINELRSQVATLGQVANMNEIAYDRDLEKIAKKMTCNTMVGGSDYMVAILPNEQGLKEMLAISDEAKLKMIEKLLAGLVAPVQTKFGCQEFTPPCIGKNGAAVAGVCAIGPQTEFRKSDAKIGEPGSMCSNGATPEGLCTVPKGEISSSSNPYFVYMIFVLTLLMAI